MLTSARGPGLRALPLPARSLVGATAVVAVAVTAAALFAGHRVPSPWWLLALAAGIAVGESLHVDLPFRRAGTAQFNLSDAALTIGLLLLHPGEVVLAAALGKLVWQLIDRVPSLKLAFNLSWYVAGTSIAALVVEVIAARPGPVEARTMVAVALGLCALTAVNTVAVGGIIALSSRQAWPATVRRIAPPLVLLTVSNAGLGLLAVLLAGTHPWALVALAVPVALLYVASRQQVHAVIDRDRSAAVVAAEHRLSDAASPAAVASALVEGVGAVLGLQAAVWQDANWMTPPPPPSWTGLPGAASAALGGDGVLVAWPGELGLTRDAGEWLARLARSGRVHLDRAAAHTALEQERATLRAVVDGTGDGIFVLDDAGSVRLWNPAMATLAGTACGPAFGQPVSAVLGSGPWRDPGVHDVDRPDGDRTWRVSVAAVQEASHGMLHVAVVHDVSADRRLARMKDDMLAVVSHELRTPLTPIKASAQLLRLRADALSEEHKLQLVTQIEGRADHLTRLVEDLLLVGQLSAGRRSPGATLPPAPSVTPVPTDLAGVVRAEVEALALGRPGHELSYEGVDTQPAVTDPLRLRQIVDNLVDNACKFSPPGSRVHVRLAVHGAEATLSVVDEGRGIARHDLERIFEPFERAEDPLHMTTSGAGLGLSIVRALATALGGALTIDSTVARGTTVTLRLPLQPPPAATSPPVAAAVGAP